MSSPVKNLFNLQVSRLPRHQTSDPMSNYSTYLSRFTYFLDIQPMLPIPERRQRHTYLKRDDNSHDNTTHVQYYLNKTIQSIYTLRHFSELLPSCDSRNTQSQKLTIFSTKTLRVHELCDKTSVTK